MTGLGFVQGRSTTTFDPQSPITRAQFAAICARFDTGTSSGTQTFSDISGHWAEKYIQRAAELGWIKGFEDGTFRPDTYITRAQAMTMINRVLNRIPEDESDLLPGMNVWPDCNPGDWFYLAVQEATNSHDFEHKAGNYETWTGAVYKRQEQLIRKNQVCDSKSEYANVAQSVEQLIRNQQVVCSSHIISSRKQWKSNDFHCFRNF